MTGSQEFLSLHREFSGVKRRRKENSSRHRRGGRRSARRGREIRSPVEKLVPATGLLPFSVTVTDSRGGGSHIAGGCLGYGLPAAVEGRKATQLLETSGRVRIDRENEGGEIVAQGE